MANSGAFSRQLLLQEWVAETTPVGWVADELLAAISGSIVASADTTSIAAAGFAALAGGIANGNPGAFTITAYAASASIGAEAAYEAVSVIGYIAIGGLNVAVSVVSIGVSTRPTSVGMIGNVGAGMFSLSGFDASAVIRSPFEFGSEHVKKSIAVYPGIVSVARSKANATAKWRKLN